MPNHSSSAIANWFIKRGLLDARREFTPMQLQKLVFMAHGWNLAVNDRETLVREPVEAWAYGPVFPRLYQVLARWGSRPVEKPITTFGSDWVPKVIEANLTRPEADVLDAVYDGYADFSGIQLSNLTHAPDTPWSRTYNPDRRNVQIPNTLIAEYFDEIAAQE